MRLNVCRTAGAALLLMMLPAAVLANPAPRSWEPYGNLSVQPWVTLGEIIPLLIETLLVACIFRLKLTKSLLLACAANAVSFFLPFLLHSEFNWLFAPWESEPRPGLVVGLTLFAIAVETPVYLIGLRRLKADVCARTILLLILMNAASYPIYYAITLKGMTGSVAIAGAILAAAALALAETAAIRRFARLEWKYALAYTVITNLACLAMLDADVGSPRGWFRLFNHNYYGHFYDLPSFLYRLAEAIPPVLFYLAVIKLLAYFPAVWQPERRRALAGFYTLAAGAVASSYLMIVLTSYCSEFIGWFQYW